MPQGLPEAVLASRSPFYGDPLLLLIPQVQINPLSTRI